MKKYEFEIEENLENEILEKEILDFLKIKGITVREVKPPYTVKVMVHQKRQRPFWLV